MTLYSDAHAWFIGLAVAVLAAAAVYEAVKRRSVRRKKDRDDGERTWENR